MDNLKRELGLEPSVEDSDVWLRVFALRETVVRVREAREAVEAELLEARKSTEGLFCATVKERLGLTDEDDGVLRCAGAMWVLDPYNAQLAVLGGAEVLAGSNPYGCNQHAHSWVERCPWDNPPEGQEWEPPKHKGKNKEKDKGGDKAGKGKGGDEKGDKGQEEKPKPGAHVTKMLAEVLGEDMAKQFDELMGKAPDWIREAYEEHVGEAIKKIIKTNGTSYYQSRTVAINPHSTKGNQWRLPLGVIFHEFAHALDGKVGKEKGSDWGMLSASELHASIRVDYEAQIKRCQEAELARAREVVKKSGGELTPDLIKAAHEAGDIPKWLYSKLTAPHRKLAVTDLLTAYIIALDAKGSNGKKPRMTKRHGTFALQEELRDKPRVAFTVCDAFRYKNGFDNDMGHRKSYYKKWGGTADGMETFAQLFSAYALEDAQTIAEVEKYLPETCARFKTLVKSMGKKKKD